MEAVIFFKSTLRNTLLSVASHRIVARLVDASLVYITDAIGLLNIRVMSFGSTVAEKGVFSYAPNELEEVQNNCVLVYLKCKLLLIDLFFRPTCVHIFPAAIKV